MLKDAAVAARLEELGFSVLARDGAAFAALIERTIDTFAGIAAERQIAAGD